MASSNTNSTSSNTYPSEWKHINKGQGPFQDFAIFFGGGLLLLGKSAMTARKIESGPWEPCNRQKAAPRSGAYTVFKNLIRLFSAKKSRTWPCAAHHRGRQCVRSWNSRQPHGLLRRARSVILWLLTRRPPWSMRRRSLSFLKANS